MILDQSKVLLLGEAWGGHEELLRHPFVGASGAELGRMLFAAEFTTKKPSDFCRNWPPTPYDMRDFWRATGFHLSNVVNKRPPENKFDYFCCKKEGAPYTTPGPISQGKYLKPEYLPELDRLRAEIDAIRPNLIVTLGAVPLWATTGRSGIYKNRGTIMPSTLAPGVKVLPTYHPAYVLRQWSARTDTIADLMKAREESRTPELQYPECELIIEPTLTDIEEYYHNHICKDVGPIAEDIETSPNRRLITCIGFASSARSAICIPFVDKRKPGYSYWPIQADEFAAWKMVKLIQDSPREKVFHNSSYDVQWLFEAPCGPPIFQRDTMLLHHALQPEKRKALGYLGSLYTRHAAWKLLHPRSSDLTEKRDD